MNFKERWENMSVEDRLKLKKKLRIRRVASFDVDCQKGFTPICPDELPVPGGHEIVDELNKQEALATWRFGSKDTHPYKANFFAYSKGDAFKPALGNNPNVDILWPVHCVVGTKGFELLDGLPKPIQYDFFVYKGMEPDCHPYGACYHDVQQRLSTGVLEYIEANEVWSVLVGGLATDYCVKVTAIQLVEAGLNVIVNLAACRGIAEDTTEKAIVEMEEAGVVVVPDLELFKIVNGIE